MTTSLTQKSAEALDFYRKNASPAERQILDEATIIPARLTGFLWHPKRGILAELDVACFGAAETFESLIPTAKTTSTATTATTTTTTPAVEHLAHHQLFRPPAIDPSLPHPATTAPTPVTSAPAASTPTAAKLATPVAPAKATTSIVPTPSPVPAVLAAPTPTK